MNIDMCMGMCRDMCIDVHGHVCGHAYGNAVHPRHRQFRPDNPAAMPAVAFVFDPRRARAHAAVPTTLPLTIGTSSLSLNGRVHSRRRHGPLPSRVRCAKHSIQHWCLGCARHSVERTVELLCRYDPRILSVGHRRTGQSRVGHRRAGWWMMCAVHFVVSQLGVGNSTARWWLVP